MVERKYGHETGHDEQIRRQLQVVYARKTREQQIFMEELKEYRKRRDKQMLKSMIEAVGPRWYQALSVPQRDALDTLESSIYQDLLEARPHRTANIMRELGIFPRPSHAELLNCIYLGRKDPKEMLSQLYLSTYGYPIEGKRASYCLNARLMLSAIFYLGLENLIELLEEKFTPDESTAEPPRKPKTKPGPPLPSPYLQSMVATLYEPPRIRRPQPLPMPNLDDLNEPYEEEPVMQKPPPPPPPPPPPKKRLPRSYCDNIAGIMTILPNPHSTQTISAKKATRTTTRKLRGSSRMCLTDGGIKKKVYGLSLGTKKKPLRRRKPVAPSTGLSNAQYTINGVYQVHGKSLYVLGNITVLPVQGEYIHGGYKNINGTCMNIHCGFRAWPPPPKPDPCDCVKKWHDTVFEHVKRSKCYCDHFYDFRNDGKFSPEELPFFVKPTRHSPLQFDYPTIFDIDEKRLQVQKEFKKLWETESVLRVNDGTNVVITDEKKKKRSQAEKESKRTDTETALYVDDGTNLGKNDKKKKKRPLLEKQSKKTRETDSVLQVDDGVNEVKIDKKKKINASDTCLGRNPKPEDYLKCALRLMRHINIAARLPDLHLVPELKEWMRRRLYGSLTYMEKKELLRKSTTYWQMFNMLAGKGFGHVSPPKDPLHAGHTTWIYKQTLNDKFKHYTHKYRLSVYRSHAYVTNLLWRSMYQAEFPDKRFREIYFSYLFSRIEDIQLLHPYRARESEERKLILAKKRYICLPDGFEPKE